MKLVSSVGISIKNDGNRSLGANCARDRPANAFRASGDQDNFVFEFEVHFVSMLVVNRLTDSFASRHSLPAGVAGVLFSRADSKSRRQSDNWYR
jgi:hypothetical protein